MKMIMDLNLSSVILLSIVFSYKETYGKYLTASHHVQGFHQIQSVKPAVTTFLPIGHGAKKGWRSRLLLQSGS